MRFDTIEALKGGALARFALGSDDATSGLFGGARWDDANPRSLQELRDNIGVGSDCRLRPVFAPGQLYLLFPDVPSALSYWAVLSDQDPWLREVRSLLAPTP